MALPQPNYWPVGAACSRSCPGRGTARMGGVRSLHLPPELVPVLQLGTQLARMGVADGAQHSCKTTSSGGGCRRVYVSVRRSAGSNRVPPLAPLSDGTDGPPANPLSPHPATLASTLPAYPLPPPCWHAQPPPIPSHPPTHPQPTHLCPVAWPPCLGTEVTTSAQEAVKGHAWLSGIRSMDEHGNRAEGGGWARWGRATQPGRRRWVGCGQVVVGGWVGGWDGMGGG